MWIKLSENEGIRRSCLTWDTAVLPPEEGHGRGASKNVLQLRPTGVPLPQPRGHNGKLGSIGRVVSINPNPEEKAIRR